MATTKEVTTVQYEISNADTTLSLANDLAKFIKEKRLCSNIQGKDFVNVEGWSYAGNRLGILPIAKKPQRIESADEVKYECEVELLHMATQSIIGYGYAICSNKEKSKKFFDEYAIASMAQTRAIGKAYRNTLAWIIKAAGYEPTPAEEMDYATDPEPARTAPTETEKQDNRLERNLDRHMDRFLTPQQSAELTEMLSHLAIDDETKQKYLKAMDKFTPERADKAIAYLDDIITKWKINNNQA